MTARSIWLPDLPYALQRTARRTASGGNILTDQLMISPAQFSASNGETGQLRRFTENDTLLWSRLEHPRRTRPWREHHIKLGAGAIRGAL